jgi:hypothetical protein
MTFNVVVRVGLIKGAKRKLSDQFRIRDSNSCDVFGRVESNSSEPIGGVRSNSFDMIGGVSPNSRDIIVYRRKRQELL